MSRRKDLTGQKFGHLTVTEMLYAYYKHGEAACRCICECGKECIKPAGTLKNLRNPPHCGCMTTYYKKIQSEKSRKNVTGKRFGSLIVDEMIYEYKKQTRCKCTCDCGNHIDTFLTYLTSGDTTSCGCIQKQRAGEANKKDFTGVVSDYDVEFLRKDYQNDHGCWMWVCRCPCCGEEFTALPAKVLNGHITSCGCARESSRERLIKATLQDRHISYIQQYRYDDCVDKKVLPFDFFLPEYNTCIEYQGEQHYHPVEKFGGEKAFELLRRHDEIKREYCERNHIPLLALPYTLSDEELTDQLLNVINP